MVVPLVPAPDCLLSLTPFPLPPETVALLRRCGPILARIQRATPLLDLRAQRGSLPVWISELVRRGVSPTEGFASNRVRLFRATFRMTGPGAGISLTDWQTRHDGTGQAAWLQEASGQAGNDLIGGPQGILDALQEMANAGGTLTFSETSPQPAREREWILSRARPGLTSRWIEDRGPLLCENRNWLGLLCLPSLESIWARELRTSNLRFLHNLLTRSWTVTPDPLPHQAVLPGLGKRSFAEATQDPPPGSGWDWSLQSNPRNPDLPPVIHSKVSAEEWRKTLNQALAEFHAAPWLLQKRPLNLNPPVIRHAMNPQTGEVQAIAGEPELHTYYLDLNGEVTIAGIIVRINPATVPIEGRKKSKGGKAGLTHLLAPCGFTGAIP
ncbi:MAG: hypothetical protein KGS60_06615 [Verrucomicrobia bacterium]|nr:hypothetical protein [Verrucomicrobiota bacterium]